MIITKFENFLNENAQENLLKMRTNVLNILKKSNDKISKANVCIVKNGKKLKLSATVTESRKPRYNPSNDAPAPIDTEVQTVKNDPIGFVFKCEGITEPIADYSIVVKSGKDVEVTSNLDDNENVLKFNTHNVQFIPDEIQARIEKKFGKIETV